MKRETELPAIQKIYDLILWIVPRTQRFPKNHRYSLGEKMESRLYTILEKLIEARWDKTNRKDLLHKANMNLNVLRYLGRISHDFGLISFKQYNYFSERIVELGRQIGGWRGEDGKG